jgi:lariat debranching enzyme
MSCPVKYRAIGDFHSYYSGINKAPYLTIFVGGNHEASSHLWELFYGGWVAPNIYYMGAANVVRLGGVRIAGMSGIWKGYNYNKTHYERLPYSQDDIKSIYHVREIDIRKLLQLRTQVDIGISHDWPRAIEKNGNERALFRMKPDFEQESKDGTLGNVAATYVMDRLRPPHWFAAHMHCRFSAIKTFDEAPALQDKAMPNPTAPTNGAALGVSTSSPVVPHNEDEIDLDMDDDNGAPIVQPAAEKEVPPVANQDEISLDDENGTTIEPSAEPQATSSVPSDLRDQLPAAFSRSTARKTNRASEPPPLEITNKVVRFLALDKCLPGRKFLQLLEVQPHSGSKEAALHAPSSGSQEKPKFEYDPEWLAITRVFASHISLGDRDTRFPPDLGAAHYRPLIEKEEVWVNEHIVKEGKLEIPENFEVTAPPFYSGMPEIITEGPREYNNPQMQQYCDLVGIENKFFATDAEREDRMRHGPAPSQERGFGGSGRGTGRGGGGGRNSRGRWRGRGRGRGGSW